MSADSAQGASIATWPVLSPHERRVLGVLAEKAKTTPDNYPLSLNALVSGCNQKSARDPVLELTDQEAEDALASVQKKGLAVKVTGSGRVDRWRHNLYDAWTLSKVELAVVAELLLRGPQTEGELRGRASRMEPIADLDTLRALLKPLAERRLVVYLSPEGRRGTLLTHGFHDPGEIASIPRGLPPAASEETISHHAEAQSLKAEVADLRQQLTELTELVHRLQAQIAGNSIGGSVAP